MKPSQKPSEDPDRPGEAAARLHAVLAELGWAPPRDESAVRRAEALPAEPADLPAALADPAAVLAGHAGEGEQAGWVLPPPADADIDATLARAAREGGAISPEVEQRMRRDRELAERESDHEADRQ